MSTADWLEYAAVLRRAIVLAALVPTLLAVGCGDDNKINIKGIGGGSKDLAVDDQLHAIQDLYQVNEFCSVIRAPKDTDLYVRAFTGALDATGDMVALAKKSPDKVFVAKVYAIDMPMGKFVQKQITILDSKCGTDGKRLAAKMRRGLGG